ncbi:MAG: thiamine-binding protein [Halodesulfurarchaeum sp.]
MSVFALLSVAPVRSGDMAADVAAAIDVLEDYDVSYETNPMATTIEAEDVDTLLAAVAGAHKAVDADRVSTVLKIDDKRVATHDARRKVEAVADVLGREPVSEDRRGN